MYSSRFYNIDQIVKDYSKCKPLDIALIYENIDSNLCEILTYQEFDDYISQASNFLLSQNLPKQSKIMLSIPNSLVFIIFLFACFRTGLVAVTVNPNLSERELQHQYTKSNSQILISYTDISNFKNPIIKLKSIKLSDLSVFLKPYDTKYKGEIIHPDYEATILFTSGTTNLPKGVISTNESYLTKICSVANHLEMTENDRHFLTLPIFHTNGQYSLLAILSVGGSAVITSRFSKSKFMNLALKHNVTLSTLFASTIRMLLLSEKNSHELNTNIRLIMFAQSVSESELTQWKKRFNINLIQIYGMSETTGMISANPLNGNKNMSIGKVLPMYKYKIINENKQNCSPYENGELLIKGTKGKTLMKGYVNDKISTAKTIINDYLHTGDVVYYDNEDFIYFVDRKNDVIKRSGENISTVEIENVLVNFPTIENASVVGIPDEIMDFKIIAYLILNNENIDLNQLKDFCKINLVPYKIPEKFIIVDKFPTTAVGKIQKYKLKEELQ